MEAEWSCSQKLIVTIAICCTHLTVDPRPLQPPVHIGNMYAYTQGVVSAIFSALSLHKQFEHYVDTAPFQLNR